MVVILNFVSFPSYCVERVLDARNLVNTDRFLTKVSVVNTQLRYYYIFKHLVT